MSDLTTLVVTAIPNPSAMESVQAYLNGVMPLFLGAGGQLVKRLKVGDVLLGNTSGMVLVMDFESREAIRAVFDSAEYSALVPVRDRGFREMNILVASEL